MKKILLSVVIIFTFSAVSLGQYFTPVWTGNGLDHMNIYVTSATIDGIPLQKDDEIGVFDGANCVGSVVRGELLTPYLEIRVSKDDPLTTGVTDGYTEGNPITFQIFDKSAMQLYASPQVTITSGNSTFTVGGTTLVTLSLKSNLPPIADAGQSKVVDEGVAVKIIGTNSYDPDGDSLSYSWTVAPTITGLDLTDDTLSFIAPEVTTNSLYNFTLIVNDGFTKVASEEDYVSLYVRDVNKIPQIIGQTTITTKEDTSITILVSMVTIQDADAGQSHTLKVLPGNYLINNNTITPLPDYNGTLFVPVRVNDGIVSSSVYELEVVVTPVNDKPKFTTSPPKSALPDIPYTYSIKAEDVDNGDILTITGTVPSWLTLSDVGNGVATLSGTPAITDVGTHNVTITVSDGTASVNQDFIITVNAVTTVPELITNELPYAYVGTAFSGSITFFDSDFDSLIVSMQGQPSWLTLENAVGGVLKLDLSQTTIVVNLIGTPTAESVGTYGVTIIFTDKTNKRSKVLPLRVLTQNTNPVAYDLNAFTNEDEPVLLSLKGTDNETPYGLEFNILESPLHGSLTKIGPKIFIYYPDANYFGKDSVSYSVFEQGSGTYGDTAKYVITIDPVNDQPVITAPQNKYDLSEGGSVTVSGVTYNDDIDGIYANSLTLESQFGPFNGTFTMNPFVYTPNTGFYGQDIVFLTAKEDITGGLVSEPLMLRFNVSLVNKPPFVAVDAIVVEEDSIISFIPLVYDREDDISNLMLELTSLPTNGTLSKSGITLTFEPAENWSGRDSLSFKIMDSQGEFSDEFEVYIYCTPVNDYPQAISYPIAANGSRTVELNFTDLVSDVDNATNELSIEFLLMIDNDNDPDSASGVFESVIVEGSTPMTFTYQATHNYGIDYIPYRVFDGQNTSTPALLTISGIPTTKKAPDKAVDTLITRGDYIDITWGDTIDLVFTVLYPNLGLTDAPELIITNSTQLQGSLSTPTVLFFSTTNPLITYRATYIAPSQSVTKARGNDTAVLFDKVGFKTRKGGSTKADIESNVDTIYVGNLQKKVPVILASIQDQTINEGQTDTVNVFFTDPDTPHDQIKFDADSSVAGTTYNFHLETQGQQVLTVTPPSGFYGTLVMNVRAMDDTTATRTQFMIHVNRVNQAPVIEAVDSIFYLKNTQRIISTIISDRETESSELDVTVTTNPVNAAFDPTEKDGDITILPSANYTQDFIVNVSVSDGELTSTKQIKMKYKASNSMPTLSSVNSVKTFEDVPVVVKDTAYDADAADLLEVSVESSNENLFVTSEINITPVSDVTGTERLLTFTPEPDKSGTSDITVYAYDGFKQAAQEFTIEVLPKNDPPVLTEVENLTMKNNQTISIPLSATDIDSYIFSYTATSSNTDLNITIVDNNVNISVLNGYFGVTSFTATVSDDSLASDNQVIQLTVEDASAVNIDLTNNLSVYPNPVYDELYISWDSRYEGKSNVSVFNIQGQVVMDQVVYVSRNTPNRISLGHIPEGLYLIKLQTSDNTYFSKVIKK